MAKNKKKNNKDQYEQEYLADIQNPLELTYDNDSSPSSNREESACTKRTQRKAVSKMTKETIALVNQYCDLLLPGFSDNGWYNAAKCLNQLSALVDLKTYSMLGALMGEMYAGPSTQKVVDTRKAVIKELQNL